jgi:hypothetical protein
MPEGFDVELRFLTGELLREYAGAGAAAAADPRGWALKVRERSREPRETTTVVYLHTPPSTRARSARRRLCDTLRARTLDAAAAGRARAHDRLSLLPRHTSE